MSKIKTMANAVEREIELEKPELLESTDLDNVVNIVGVDLVFQKVMAQLTIDFRSHIRGKLSSKTDDEFTNSDDDIMAMDFSEWKPETRTRMTKEDKAAKALSTLTPEEIASVLAQVEANKEA